MLANMFHYYFQRVEIFIDDIPILYPSQLDTCTPDYQAKLLVLRGYHLEWTGEGEQRHTQFRPVEIRANKSIVTLVGWAANDKRTPEAAIQLKNFFDYRQNDLHSGLVSMVYWGVYWGVAMAPILEINHRTRGIFSYLLMPYEIIAGVLFGLASLVLFAFILGHYQLDTYVFLLPGAVQTDRTYGGHEVSGTVLVGVVYFILLSILLLLGAEALILALTTS